ncbi:MAG: hydantoinase/oxoprolinase family protein [Rhodospirillaceae bacterium]|jgi:N-methylhydantoinase A|nr:hydantoinase/oxoprolinase family protein [Rhodospirillaceae bacterium]MBT6137715.1 hydantoinase/oxoprolinase family protein [Rhodospirillaceae bacterium]
MSNLCSFHFIPPTFNQRHPLAQQSLGIDIGGTFTDIVVYDHGAGRQYSNKILTTHDDPSRAVIEGVGLLVEAGRLDPISVSRVVHATTLFTNALIERKGAVTGLITTAGFRDVLEIGRERKYDLYDIAIKKPQPLVPRELRLEADERIAADGSVITALDTASVRQAGEALAAAGANSLAVVFLHAYLDPEHERAALDVLRETCPGLSVTASHEVAPEVREFERASTTVANAYIKPLAEGYLDAMDAKLGASGISAPLHLMISSGGLTHVAEAKRTPVAMLESGPAAGALAGAFFGREDASGNLLAFDMGGTTAKLSLVEGGEPLITYDFEAGREKRLVVGSGLPIRISTIELIEIGAGGGSIAAIDDLGFLKVGPRSAGSEPGPAAYGQGGEEATVTDADFTLGYLNPDFFAGGMLSVDMDAAHAALDRVAEKAGLTRTEIAWGIHDIVNENMAGAARVHIAERGRDPRDFALLCTGGAGPVHAYYVARKLGLRRLVCPNAAGVASAAGLLVAPGRVDRVATVGVRLDACDISQLEGEFRRLEEDAMTVIAETGLDPSTTRFQRLADGRFTGQGFELVVPLPVGPYAEAGVGRDELLAAFEAAYREKFSRTPPNVPVEFINIRVSARAPVPGGEVLLAGQNQADGQALKGTRPAYFPEARAYLETNVYDREKLIVGQIFEGPAIIEDEGSTLIVGPGASVEIAATGNIVVTLPDLEGEAA